MADNVVPLVHSSGSPTDSTVLKRPRKQQSTTSLASRTSRSKRLRPGISRTNSAVSVSSRPAVSRNNSSLSVKLQLAQHDDIAVVSGDEADSVAGMARPVLFSGTPDDNRPEWAVRHRIYLDSELLSTVTSTRRPGLHMFQDILLREQTEIRLNTPNHGHDAHFATRHATLRFWRTDGSLAERWMDKDMGGEQEHEFAMENLNDWAIVNLSMGESDVKSSESTQDEPGDEIDADKHSEQDTEILPILDIISHYVSDYDDARNIASAPGIESEDDSPEPQEPTSHPALVRETSGPVYHWVEERRRALEHQLRCLFHCTSPSCPHAGDACLALLPDQHLPIGPKDLTDWSQQIAHAHRPMAAATIHLAAKLLDDAARVEDEELAAEGRERDDEDDLGQVLADIGLLGALRPAGADAEPAELDMLD